MPESVNRSIVLLEDEENSRDFLTRLIADYAPGFNVVGTAATVEEGVPLIDHLKPDLLLLDIQLKDGLSFQVLDQISHRDYQLIFITGYSQYAIRAIKLAALDYVMKPIDLDEFLAALNKATHHQEDRDAKLELFKAGMNKHNLTHMMVYSQNAYWKLAFQDIYSLVSEGSYTHIKLKDKEHLTSNSLGYYQDSLPSEFFRVHHSTIINCNKITKVSKGRGGSVRLENGLEYQIAYRRKAELLALMDQLKRTY